MNNTCNTEKYLTWYNEAFPTRLGDSMLLSLLLAQRKDKKIWEIMNFDDARESYFAGNTDISNGQVMELSGHLCRRSLISLKESLAGHHAPVNDRDIHSAMCSNECLLNDRLRFASMNMSNCNCLELSVPNDSDVVMGDDKFFCKENSGEYLCEDLGRCGEWLCEVADYACKRRFYDQQEVPLKGYGNDCSGASRHMMNTVLLSIVVLFSFFRLL